MNVVLSYSSLFTRSIETLPDFYIGLLGLKEIEASRSAKYREVEAGGVKIGFIHQGGYAMLDLGDYAEPTGMKSILTFAAPDAETVERLAEDAVKRGGTLAKAPFTTFFGQYQCVLIDPEGNAFRVSTPAKAA
jgi:predicted enzyme related to lactoylglutathione lyase